MVGRTYGLTRYTRKRELLDKYLKNLGQSVVQEQNKVVGRLGVNPGT